MSIAEVPLDSDMSRQDYRDIVSAMLTHNKHTHTASACSELGREDTNDSDWLT